MSTQITVRLPEQLVHEVDRRVSTGEAASRADLVAQAISRELRRRRAIEDLDRLDPPDAEHDSLHSWMQARAFSASD